MQVQHQMGRLPSWQRPAKPPSQVVMQQQTQQQQEQQQPQVQEVQAPLWQAAGHLCKSAGS